MIDGPFTNEGTLRWEDGPVAVARTILTNAVHLSYAKRLGFTRHTKVLMWCSTAA